jgi:predicted ATPase/serine/threonine protein kinase
MVIPSWSTIERLFHQALTRSVEERRPFLDRACKGDRSLRRAVEELLDSDSQASGFLTAPMVVRSPSGSSLMVGAFVPNASLLNEGMSSPVQHSFEFAAEATIGGYRIVRPLGRGGMGEVYEAQDLMLGRHVAIKVLKDFSDSAAARQRLLTEARTASSLNHPHIVTIHSIDCDQDGRDFLVMEYVEGLTMRERLAAGALEVDELVTVAGQIADALAAAHARGIVHHDLKPENVMFAASGQLKLLDFGVAAWRRPQTDHEPALRARDPVVGSLHYMSPEQAAGKQTDFRSDQFAFGSILYEAASGVRPFDGSNAGQILSAVLQANPPPLATRCPGIPDPLRWVIERCLARDPADRYPSTEVLHRELTMLHTRLFDVKVRDDIPAVPVPRTSLVGRANELTKAKGLVLDEQVPLLTLTGPAGVGKTRLVLEIAGLLSGRFGNRIFFVDLSRVASPELVPETIAAAIGVRETVENDMAASLRRWVRERQHWPILIVIDNFEHVLAAAPLVGELLTASRSLTVLATSRTALRLAGEHELAVAPLALPGTRATRVNDICDSPAVMLFVQRAMAAKSDFALIADNAVSVARICERLDGLPLAIELAAARVRQLTPVAILSRLEHRLDLLTGGPRDAPVRQRTLRAAIEWSHELLDERERMLFRRLTVFSGGCTLEGVEAVCNTHRDVGENVEDVLGRLIEKSMVLRMGVGDPFRVTLLETIREFATERLAAGADGEPTRRAHAAYCLVLAEEGYGLRVRQQADWMTRCQLEYANHRVALEWLIERHHFEWGARLAAGLMPFWHALGFLSEGRDWLRRLLALPCEAHQLALRADALKYSAYLMHQQGDLSTCWQRHVDESLAIYSELGDRWNLVQATSDHAIVLAQLGRHAAARATMEATLSLWRELRDERGEARALANLATLAKVAGDHARARQLCTQSRELFQRTGDVEAIAWSLNHEADAARWAGDRVAAHNLLGLALERFRDAGDDLGCATCLADQARIHVDESPSLAEREGFEALRILVTAAHTRGVARVLETLARLAWRQGAPRRALRLAGAAAAVRREFDRLDALEFRHTEDIEGFQQMIAESRQHAGADAASVWMQGWSAPLQDTVEYALRRESD